MLRKIAFLLIILVYGCSDDTEELNSEFKIQEIFPVMTQIGDTVTIKGVNLDKIPTVFFQHISPELKNYDVSIGSPNFISRSINEIQVVVPEMRHENIKFRISNGQEFGLELFGWIPVSLKIGLPVEIQILDSKTAFVHNSKKVYKSTDSFKTWSLVYEVYDEQWISSFYYLDEKNCWIGLVGANKKSSLHFSNNGGIDYEKKFDILPNNSSTYWINKIHFSSLSNGFFSTEDYRVFKTDNDNFEDVYDAYPELNTLPYGRIEVYDFTLADDNLIFLAPTGTPYLTKIDNGIVSYSKFDVWPSRPEMFGNNGFMAVSSDIFKTLDKGETWQKIKTFEGHSPRIDFLDKNHGFSFVNYTPAEMFETLDGGASWKSIMPISVKASSFSDINGLISTLSSGIWKYRKF